MNFSRTFYEYLSVVDENCEATQRCIDDAVAGEIGFNLVELHLHGCRHCTRYLLQQLEFNRQLQLDAARPHLVDNLPGAVWGSVSLRSGHTWLSTPLRWMIGLLGVACLTLLSFFGPSTHGLRLSDELLINVASTLMGIVGFTLVIASLWPEWSYRLRPFIVGGVVGSALATLAGRSLSGSSDGLSAELFGLGLGIAGMSLLLGSQWLRRPRAQLLEMRFMSTNWRESRSRRIGMVLTMSLLVSIPFVALSSWDLGSRPRTNVGSAGTISELSMRRTGVVCMKTRQAQGSVASRYWNVG